MRYVFVSWVLTVSFWFQSPGFAQQASDSSDKPAAQHIAQLNQSPVPPTSQAAAPRPQKHKIGPFDISINWRTRTEGWQWFEGNTGNNEYSFFDSMLRVGIGQTREKLDWFIEGEQASILGLPNDAVVPN